MKNLRIRTKLMLAFAIVAILAAISGIVGIVGLNTLNDNEEGMYQQSLRADDATRLLTNIQEQRAAYRGAALKKMINTDYAGDIAMLAPLDNEFNETLKHLERTLELATNKELLAAAKTAYIEYSSLRDSFVDAIGKDGEDVLIDILLKITAPIDAVTANLKEVSKSAIQVINERNAEDSETAFFMIVLLSVMAVLSVGSAIFFIFYITSLVAAPLIQLAGEVKNKLAVGNLKLETHIKQKDEIGMVTEGIDGMIKDMLAQEQNIALLSEGDLTVSFETRSEEDVMNKALNSLVEKMNDIFAEISTSTSQVTVGAKQIADGAQSLAQGSTEQAAAVEQLSSSINEISEKSSGNAEMAARAADLANTIKNNAEKGSRQMNEMTIAVNDINQASQKINRVIKVIDDIAFQTNILALNAAVEAARAGQHGRGFAIVAEEVRNLAGKSAEAARDTGEMIADAIEKAELGARLAEETSSSLKEIVSGIMESSRIVSDIARASEEQSAGISQINTGIDQVALVVQQNSATAEESAASSEEMSGQADMLEGLVAQFKLRDKQSQGFRSEEPAFSSFQRRLTLPDYLPSSSRVDYGKY